MIRLSDVKVRMQYRWRVRQRLMVLHFARLHGPTAAARRFGVSVRTIRRWRVRWRQGGLEGLVPRYPRRRGRRVTPRVIELIGQARSSPTAPPEPSSGFAAFTTSASPWARSSAFFAISASRVFGGRESGSPGR